MLRCETYQDQLLDAVYGLLDPAETVRLDEHVAGCPACHAAREQVVRFRTLLGWAAKSEFPEVVFQPPVEPLPAVEPAQPARQTQTIRRTWMNWVIAASLFLATASIIGPATRDLIGYALYKPRVNREFAAVTEARNKKERLVAIVREKDNLAVSRVEQAQKAHDHLVEQFLKAEQHVITAARERPFSIDVRGPARAVAGAPNDYTVQILDRNDTPRSTPLDVKVRDADGAIVFEQSFPAGGAAARQLRLPAAMWDKAKPGTDLTLHLTVSESGATAEVREQIRLLEPVYTTHLVTDRPMYRPGETIFFRSLTLDRARFLPPTRDLNLQFRLIAPNGTPVPNTKFNGMATPIIPAPGGNWQPVLGPDGKPVRGIGTGVMNLPPTAPGGEYRLQVHEISVSTGEPPPNAQPLAERKFFVNRYTPERIEKKFEFDARTYGPGDVVQAKLQVRDQGKPLAKVGLNWAIEVDGQQIQPESASAQTAPDGTAAIRFRLPPVAEIGYARLTVTVLRIGGQESLSRPIPIASRTVAIEFFPEGGDLVAGVPNRVYFRASTATGRPADIAGVLTDGANPICEVRTFTDAEEPGVNQGVGVFTFTPEKGRHYTVRLDRPVGSKFAISYPSAAVLGVAPALPFIGALPPARTEGVVLSVPKGVTKPGEPIPVQLISVGKKRTVVVGAYIRGLAVAHQRAVLEPDRPTDLLLDPGRATIGGVTRITVFEEPEGNVSGRDDLRPIAERLVFRQSSVALKMNVSSSKQGTFIPGEKVDLTIRSTDETGQPKPAILWAAVVNQSVIAMADEKSARLMPTHFLLGGEIRRPDDLEHADFLLTDHPKAATALDLVLGTQGWRRFAEQAPGQFKSRTPSEDRDRLVLAMSGGGLPPSGWRSDVRRVFNEYWPQYEAAALELDAAERDRRNRTTSHEARTELSLVESEYLARMMSFGSAVSDLETFDKSATYRKDWLPGTVILFFGLASVLGAFSLVRRRYPDRRSLAFGALGFLVLGLLTLATVGLTEWGSDAWRNEATNAPRPSRNTPYGPYVAPSPPPKPSMPDEIISPLAGGPEVGMPAPKLPPGPRIPRDDGPGIVPPDFRVPEPGQAAPPVNRVPVRPKLGPPSPTGEPLGERLRKEFNRRARQIAGSSPPDQSLTQARDSINELAPQARPLVVREYAHVRPYRSEWAGPEARTDFTETLLWQPVLITGPDGTAKVSFDLSDAISGYQVLVAGHTLDGRLGAVTRTIEVRKPFAVDPRLPPELGSADQLDLPIGLTNSTDTPRQADVLLQPKGLKVEGDGKRSIELAAHEGGRTLMRVTPDLVEGVASVRVTAETSHGLTDIIERPVTIVPDGFPAQGSHSDLLEQATTTRLNLPPQWVRGSLKVSATLFPNTLAELQAGLAGLLREPSGCFEQSSTTNYPNVLITELLRESNQANPDISRRARELMDRGYTRLVGYECPKTGEPDRIGYEWFGAADNPHEALTAFGLVQFTDMSRVYPVDPQMLERTRRFLLDSRDGRGGFKRNARALDTFGRAPEPVTNAYIVWALTESERNTEAKSDLTKELDTLVARTMETEDAKDPYFLALVANALLNRGRQAEAVKLLQSVAKYQTASGSVTGARTSITQSAGRDLLIETTAFASLGWLKANRADLFTAPIQSAMKWIGSQRNGSGAFGSTQATILALKAAIEFARANRRPAETGEVRVLVGGKEIGKRAFSSQQGEPVVIDILDPDNAFPPGPIELRIETTARQPYPLTVAWSCQTRQPASAADCPVALETRLANKTLLEGESVRLTVTLQNQVDRTHGMVVAIVGIPAGLKLPEDLKQLRTLTDRPTDGLEPVISYWETRGRELILYWRGLTPKQKITLGLDLIADVPGEFRGPASRVYLYYNADHKHWIEPVEVTIRPRANPRSSASR